MPSNRRISFGLRWWSCGVGEVVQIPFAVHHVISCDVSFCNSSVSLGHETSCFVDIYKVNIVLNHANYFKNTYDIFVYYKYIYIYCSIYLDPFSEIL